MTTILPEYSVVTPVRTEETNLRRLAAALEAQSHRPKQWVIVDNGSEDGTEEVARELAASRGWVTVLSVPGAEHPAPGAPIVRAFHVGLQALRERSAIIVKLDADTSMDPDHFERLARAFAEDPRLGIASGTCLELNEHGTWRPVAVSLGHVRGAARAYRRECLEQVLPLEEGVGWDGIDGWKANARGWATRMLPDLGFYHHRPLGSRDGARGARWRTQGRAAWYLGYRFSYLLLRTVYRLRQDRAAGAMLAGYIVAALRREPRLADAEVRSHLREMQRLRALAGRRFESRGMRPT